MSNIKPIQPSFVFGYWRPWNENANLFDSYLDYARDTSLLKYSADTVGKYIKQASKEQVKAINQLGQDIGRGINVLSNQMAEINESLVFLNRNLDVQIEQQKLSGLLLQNIAELLRVPDSEKERQHSIELGIKFFVNASKDADLYADALEELLRAEALMKQDYFVLHRIGCIFLYIEKYINPEKALDYFLRAAKYASVESDSNAVRLANILTSNFNTVNTELNNSEKQIGFLAADSFEKAAFASYVLGRFSDAVNYQAKALKLNETPQNRFILSKYQIRNGEISEGISNLSKSIDDEPVYAVAAFKEIDLINAPEVLNLIANKNKNIDNEISKLMDKWMVVESTKAFLVIEELAELFQKSYETKVLQFKSFETEANEINKNIKYTVSKIDAYIPYMKQAKFCTFDTNKIQSLIDELTKAKDLPLEEMKIKFDNIQKLLDANELKIGKNFAGGIVFYIDITGNHGLVVGSVIPYFNGGWGCIDKIGADGDGVADGSGMANTKKIVEHPSHNYKGFFSSTKTQALTPARLCLEYNGAGYTDWYLPTRSELNLIFKTLNLAGRLGGLDEFWSSTEGAIDITGYYSKYAYCFDIKKGYATQQPKGNRLRKGGVLPIRAFTILT